MWCHSNLFPEKVTQRVSLQKIANPLVISWLKKRLDKHSKKWVLLPRGGQRDVLFSFAQWTRKKSRPWWNFDTAFSPFSVHSLHSCCPCNCPCLPTFGGPHSQKGERGGLQIFALPELSVGLPACGGNLPLAAPQLFSASSKKCNNCLWGAPPPFLAHCLGGTLRLL